jgi:hypothetical protein
MSTYEPGDVVDVVTDVDEEPTTVRINATDGIWHYGESIFAPVQREFRFMLTQIVKRHGKFRPDDIVFWTAPNKYIKPQEARLRLIETGIVGLEPGWWKAVDVDHGFEYTVREQDFIHWDEPASPPAAPKLYKLHELYRAKRKLKEAIEIIDEQIEELTNVNEVDTGDQGFKDNSRASG